MALAEERAHLNEEVGSSHRSFESTAESFTLLRKLLIGLLLSSGVFVIIATVLRIFFVVQSQGVNNVTM